MKKPALVFFCVLLLAFSGPGLGGWFTDPFDKAVNAYEEKDYKKAFDLFREAIKKNDYHSIDAQGNLGIMYANGVGVKKDDVNAVRWFRKAAEQGNSAAQKNLGEMYRLGRGVPQNDAEAVRWFRIAAEQGDADAQLVLGDMYRLGKGVSQDNREAIDWYWKAAEQGNVKAQFNLGNIYRFGQGVVKNNKEAARWYIKAADKGYADAQIALGNMYRLGGNKENDDADAVGWYRQVSEQDFATAKLIPEKIIKTKTPITYATRTMMLPKTDGKVGLRYRIPGNPELNLSDEVIADIFLGKIDNWQEDKRLVAANPNIYLPKEINVIVRSDPSEATYFFTKYLSKLSKEFKDKIGYGEEVEWPAAITMLAHGDDMAILFIKMAPFSVSAIGYVEVKPGWSRPAQSIIDQKKSAEKKDCLPSKKQTSQAMIYLSKIFLQRQIGLRKQPKKISQKHFGG